MFYIFTIKSSLGIHVFSWNISWIVVVISFYVKFKKSLITEESKIVGCIILILKKPSLSFWIMRFKRQWTDYIKVFRSFLYYYTFSTLMLFLFSLITGGTVTPKQQNQQLHNNKSRSFPTFRRQKDQTKSKPPKVKAYFNDSIKIVSSFGFIHYKILYK